MGRKSRISNTDMKDVNSHNKQFANTFQRNPTVLANERSKDYISFVGDRLTNQNNQINFDSVNARSDMNTRNLGTQKIGSDLTLQSVKKILHSHNMFAGMQYTSKYSLT
jgi:hypothetical protein